MYVLVPMNVSMILQSWRWWIFRVGIPHTTWRICRSPNWNDPQTDMGMSPIWNIDPNRFGDPRTNMGIGFFGVFSVTHKIAFSCQKLRQSQRHSSPLLAKNLGNQPTAPANQELGKQEEGRESLAAARQRRQHQWRWWRRKEWRRYTARQRQSAAAVEVRRWCTSRWWQRGCSSVDAAGVAAAQQRNVGGSLAAARRQWQHQRR